PNHRPSHAKQRLAELIHQLVESGLLMLAQPPQERLFVFLPYMVPALIHFLPRIFRFFPRRATSMMESSPRRRRCGYQCGGLSVGRTFSGADIPVRHPLTSELPCPEYSRPRPIVETCPSCRSASPSRPASSSPPS